MPVLTPPDRTILATAVADSAVVAAHPDARQTCMYYWELARPWTCAVADAVRESPDPTIRSVGGRLLDDPGDPAAYRELRDLLIHRPADRTVGELFQLGWESESNSRVGHHLGDRYTRDVDPVTVDELSGAGTGPRLPSGADPEILVVIPFRERNGDGNRLRNLLAALRSLRDQSIPREAYRVTVVECDDAPHWSDAVTPYVDTYLFAPSPGRFNRSWAMNTGVENSPGRPKVVCMMDADVLADRDFVARNAARFRRPGTGGHLPYRNMTCLDAAATAAGIRQRLGDGAAQADPARLRAFQQRRSPGCCAWVRADIFRRVGGMDERYAGWGGEDYDFAYRFDMTAPFDIYDDWLLHMHHPPVAALQDDGGEAHAALPPPLDWPADSRIGQLDRFATAASMVGG